MPPHFIARQLAHPRGLLGRAVRALMNRHNAAMNAFALRQLDPLPGDRVLEVGFGGGVMLPALIGAAAFVAGVDRSRDAVDWASRRFRAAVSAGQADFRVGSIEALPCRPASFHKACTVNTVYFWRSLDEGFAELGRVLRPGGRAVVGFLPKPWMDRAGYPADLFEARHAEEVAAGLRQNGFDRVRIEAPAADTKWKIAIGERT